MEEKKKHQSVCQSVCLLEGRLIGGGGRGGEVIGVGEGGEKGRSGGEEGEEEVKEEVKKAVPGLEGVELCWEEAKEVEEV